MTHVFIKTLNRVFNIYSLFRTPLVYSCCVFQHSESSHGKNSPENSDRSKGVKSICILQNPGFNCVGAFSSAETVGQDAACNGFDKLFSETCFPKEFGGYHRAVQGMVPAFFVFLYNTYIMEESSKPEYKGISSFLFTNFQAERLYSVN